VLCVPFQFPSTFFSFSVAFLHPFWLLQNSFREGIKTSFQIKRGEEKQKFQQRILMMKAKATFTSCASFDLKEREYKVVDLHDVIQNILL